MAAMNADNTGDKMLQVSSRVLEGLVRSLQQKDRHLQYFQEQSKLINTEQLLRQPRHSVPSRNFTGKASLSRTVSEPQRKVSNPEIFIFPDVQQKSIPRKSSDSLQSRSLSVDAGEDPASEPAVVDHDVTRARRSTSNIFQFPAEQPLSSADYEASDMLGYRRSGLESPGTPGVSEQYFNNVVDELLKTKRYLHALQTKLDSRVDSSAQTESLGQSVGQPQLQTDQLQDSREYHQPGRQKDGGLNDSFELESTMEMMHESHTSTQTDPLDNPPQNKKPQSSHEQVETLRNQNDQLKSSINVFTSLLQEEKARSKSDSERLAQRTQELNLKNNEVEQIKQTMKVYDDKMEHLTQTLIQQTVESEQFKQTIKHMNDENVEMKQLMKQHREEKNKLCEQLGHLRTQFEELQTEKNAMEKERQISLPESLPSGSQYHSTRSRVQSGLCDKFPTGNRSQSDSLERPNFGGSSEKLHSGTGSQDSLPWKSSPRSGGVVSLNQLSVSRSPSDANDLNMSHVGGPGVAYDVTSHQEMNCPRCQQEFQVEQPFLEHLQKCLD